MRDWVEETVVNVSVVLILAVLMLSLIAPVLGPWFRREKVRAYAMYPDWEQRVKSEMPWVYGGLTVWALIAWAILFALT